MADAAANNSGDYTGTFEHGVDASFRVMLPSTWHPADKDTLFTMIPWPVKDPDHLLVLPPDRWELVKQRLKETFSLTSKVGSVVLRAITGSAVRKKLDDAGRLCLGEKLAKLVHLNGKAALVGCNDTFEIWEPGRLATVQGLIHEVPDETLENLRI
jgi:division/cell wall cluster transcriptional repressor MraZ